MFPRPLRLSRIASLAAAATLAVTVFGASDADAQRRKKKPAKPVADSDKIVRVAMNGSTHLKFDASLTRVSIGSDIAEVNAYGSNEVVVTGKRLGTTTLMVWKGGSRAETWTVVVGYPRERIIELLNAAIPDIENLQVEDAGATLIVAGDVPSVADVERAEAILRGFLPGGTTGADAAPGILNMLRVTGDHQVQLEVAFAEVSRSGLKQIGINLWSRNVQDNWSGGLFNPQSNPTPNAVSGGVIDPAAVAGELPVPSADGTPIVIPPIVGAFNAVFGLGNDYEFPFSAALSVLANRGYARTLAEPTLVAMSGKKASFLAGGEFPLPLPQALGQVTIEFKKFGVQLEFLPTVVDDTIQLDVDMSVSDLDFSLGIKLANVTVPGLTKRFSSTTVRLKDGQSFAIAGLLSDKVRSNVDKVPWLGDIPILGTLFRSTRYQREETELMVVVTARLARPQGERPRLPGEDTTTDPTDLELFFLGSSESKQNDEPPRSAEQPAGPVGFRR
jgi:pilus assembly protein CpaC